MKEVGEDANKWKIPHVLGLEELILLKFPYTPQTIYRFSATSIKIPMAFSTELEKTILKLVWNHKRS